MPAALFAYLPSNIPGLFLFALIFVLGLTLLFKLKKTEYIIYFLLIWFPLESLILMYTPIEYYAYVKYTPELILYGLAVGSIFIYVKKNKTRLPRHPLLFWVLIYLVIALISLALNHYNFFDWVLGVRQISRFFLVALAILFVNYPREVLKKFVLAGAVMIGLEVLLATIQYLFGGALDKFLFSTNTITLEIGAVLGGMEQVWTTGSRVFATLGRYDRLGSFLALGLIMAFPWFYQSRTAKQRYLFWLVFISISAALALTASRASWLAAFFGIAAIGIFAQRDKRVLRGVGIFAGAIAVYLLGFALVSSNLMSITYNPNQSFAERMFEAVSPRSWRESYEGYGRIFFIVNTPRLVVPAAPLFGFGPGRYGGGVAAARLNTDVYDRLRLPFGIENYYGQIDNSWFSIWGEVGTLGMIAWIMIFVSIIKMAKTVVKKTRDQSNATFALGCIGSSIGMVVIGFFGPYFEFRALMFYFWLIAGILMVFWREEKGRGNFLHEI